MKKIKKKRKSPKVTRGGSAKEDASTLRVISSEKMNSFTGGQDKGWMLDPGESKRGKVITHASARPLECAWFSRTCEEGGTPPDLPVHPSSLLSVPLLL